MKVIFWGTPVFSLPALSALLGEGHEVVAVVTQPDRPAGRGRVLKPPPVKTVAEGERVPVWQPERARGAEFVEELRALEADISIVVAYGQILPRAVLDVPRLGSLNVHASMLPELRGAAPINWSIMRGHRETGVSVMRMVEKMDAGPILFQVIEPIGPDETATDLGTRLSELGAQVLIETLMLIEAEGSLEERAQNDDLATYAPRLTRESTHTDWSRAAREVANHIRGLDALPGAWTVCGDTSLGIFRPQADAEHEHNATPGTVLEVDGNNASEGMLVACGAGAVWVREVKPAGKRRMTTAEWVRGRGIAARELLS